MIDFIVKYHFLFMQFAGIFTFFSLYIRKSKIVRTEWDKVAQFCAFMVLMVAIRFGLMSSDPNIKFEKSPASFEDFLWVFWEDMFFALSIWFVKDYLGFVKKIWLPFAVGMSAWFAYYHLGYGVGWAAITLLYPYFISYNYGKKYGWGTVCACHIIYDFMSLLSIKLFQLTLLVS